MLNNSLLRAKGLIWGIFLLLFTSPLFASPLLVAQVAPGALKDSESVPGERSLTEITIENAFALEFLPFGVPRSLGPQDQLDFSRPLHTLTLQATTPQGLRARITNILVMEYHLDHRFSFEQGPAGNPIPFENNSVVEGFLEVPLSFGTLTLGRQNVHFGPSRLSSLLISSQIPYLDALVFKARLGSWQLEQAVATLENRKMFRGGDVLESFWEDDGTENTYGFEKSIILFSSRRFSWSNSWLEIGIGANALLTRENNAFQFGDVFPIFSIHQGDVGVNNLSTMVDLRVSPFPSLNVYAMAGLDDVNSNAVGIDDFGVPTIGAFIGGVFGNLGLGPVAFEYDVEFGTTHYLWGSYDDEYALSRAIYRLWNDNRSILIPLTSRFGPARTHIEAIARFQFPSQTSLSVQNILLYGDSSINLTTTPYREQSSQQRFLLYRLDLGASQQLPLGFRIHAGLGFDIQPQKTLPRVAIGLEWRNTARLFQP